MLPSSDWTEILTRLVLAIALGGLLGIEREALRKPAGLRTHMMVCLGAATFTLVTLELYSNLAASPSSAARFDPLRIIEGVIGGIGFLGAGSIIRNGGSVEGLTTAGSLWLVGAIGIAVGAGHYVVAGLAVTLALVVLRVFGFLQTRISG